MAAIDKHKRVRHNKKIDMSELRDQKRQVMQQFREAAWEISREAKEMGVPVPPSAMMVLRADDNDFIVAQHRGPASPARVAKEISAMRLELDAAARTKLGATAVRLGGPRAQEIQAYNYQNRSDAG